MDCSDNAYEKTRSCLVVGLNGYGIGIGATCGLQVFHPENAAVFAGAAFLYQFTTNEIISLCLYPQNIKGIIFVWQDLHLDRKW